MLTKTDVSELKNKVYDDRDRHKQMLEDRRKAQKENDIINSSNGIYNEYSGEEIIDRFKTLVAETCEMMYGYELGNRTLRVNIDTLKQMRLSVRIWEEAINHIDPAKIYLVSPAEAIDLRLNDVGKPSIAELEWEERVFRKTGKMPADQVTPKATDEKEEEALAPVVVPFVKPGEEKPN